MTNGGKRQGSGRKPGALTKRTRAIAEELGAEGITPLEVLVNSMRMAWSLAAEEDPKGDHRAMAISCAEKAAPYMHAKIATVTVGGQADNPLVGKLIVEWGKRE
jgi:hypothetical protein